MTDTAATDAPTAPYGLARVADTLRDLGFRAESVEWGGVADGALRSAAAGVGFNVVPGTADADGTVRDLTLVSQFTLPHPLPDLPQEWNSQRRFARVYFREGMLAIEMDLILGTAGAEQMRLGLELWNRLLNELLSLLRARLETPA